MFKFGRTGGFPSGGDRLTHTTLRRISLIAMLSLALLLALAACEDDTGTSDQSTPNPEGTAPADVSATGDTSGQSVLQGQEPTSTPTTGATPTTTSPTEPGILKPEGYYHGENHGLALVQTSRRPSETRDGWVDITLNMVAIRFDIGQMHVRDGAASLFCFGDAAVSADCFSVKWGSTDQNEAELQVTGFESAESRKAVNFQATFEVAANATNANLYFGEHEIPLDLEGDYALNANPSGRIPAPTPPPSQDPKTAGFFMDEEHGIAVTGIYRTVHGSAPTLVTGRVELAVLSPADYDASAPPPSNEGGGVCLGKGETECMAIFWGPERQFNALLSLSGGEAFSEARRAGARWPLPLTLGFRLPSNQDSAVLMFGEHSIPLDLRGMRGGPVFDYTAHYPEAVPGSVLYDSGGKTVVLEQVRQDPESGSLEVEMTATNGSEASDFTPAFLPSGIFSTDGPVGHTCFVGGEKLAPGQSASLRYVVPRAGNEEWGYIAYSQEQGKRPDGVVLLMGDFEVGDLEAPAGVAPAAPADGSIEAVSLRSRDCPLRADILLEGATPSFVRFDRSGDEGKFWPVKWLWLWQSQDTNTGGANFNVTDGRVYLFTPRGSSIGYLGALDAATGEKLWEFQGADVVGVVDGVVYAIHGKSLIALDAATGEFLWTTGTIPCHNCYFDIAEGVLVSRVDDLLLVALDAVTGETLWDNSYGVGFLSSRTKVTNGAVVYGTTTGGTPYALDVTTGETLWTNEENLLGHSAYIRGVTNGVVYLTSSFGLVALDAATGDTLWERRWEERHSLDRAAVAGGVVYLFGKFGLVALDAATGDTLWERRWEEERRVVRRTAVAGGAVYSLFDEELIAVDATTGEILWEGEATWGEGYSENLSVANGAVYVSNPTGMVVLDAGTGEEFLRVVPGRELQNPEFVVPAGAPDRVVYVVSGQSGIYLIYAVLAETSSR